MNQASINVGNGRHTDHEEQELFELTEDGRLPDLTPRHTAKYEDGSTIDWLHEEAAERQRNQALRSLAGVRGVLLPAMEAAKMWIVVIATGMGIGIAGAWLDVLVKWWASYPRGCTMNIHHVAVLLRLGDLREGRCSYGFFYNQAACCSGLDRMPTNTETEASL